MKMNEALELTEEEFAQKVEEARVRLQEIGEYMRNPTIRWSETSPMQPHQEEESGDLHLCDDFRDHVVGELEPFEMRAETREPFV